MIAFVPVIYFRYYNMCVCEIASFVWLAFQTKRHDLSALDCLKYIHRHTLVDLYPNLSVSLRMLTSAGHSRVIRENLLEIEIDQDFGSLRGWIRQAYKHTYIDT